jgi:uncharacterized protein
MTIKEKVEHGLALSDMEIIDAHAHLGVLSGFYHCDPSPERMIRDMFALGIKQTAVSPHMGLQYSASEGNKMMYQALQKYPQLFLGYITINPHFPEIMEAELNEYWGKKNIVGVKIHPASHNCAVTDKKYVPLWEHANRLHIPILSHTWYGTSCAPAFFGPLAEKYPQVIFILGHMGGAYQGIREAIEVAKRCPNIYLEMCGWEFSETWFDYITENFTADRLLFGTDNPWHNPAYSFGRLAYSRIPDEDKEKIFGLNFKKIITRKI